MEKLFYQYGVDLALWAHEHSYERLWPVYDRKVSGGVGGGGGGREAVLSVQRGPGPLGLWTLLWMTVACLCQKDEWTGFFRGRVAWGWRGVGAGGEAVLSVWHGHGPLGPWILLWMTVACLWQKDEWTVGVEEGGWGWGSVSMVWTWPCKLCY